MNNQPDKGKSNPLSSWISSHLLESSWIEQAHQQFQNDPARMIVVDDVLEPARHQLLSQALRIDCDWQSRQGIIRHRPHSVGTEAVPTEWVDAATFAQTTPGERFFQHKAFARARPGHEMSPGMIGLVQFKSLMNSPAFLDMLGRITGARPQGLHELLIRRMSIGDMTRPHDDAIAGRTFCIVLYLSDGWDPAYDGRFIMHMPDGDRSIDPLPNRMVLFDVNTGLKHSVRSLNATPPDWHRYNFSIWFT